MEGPLTASPPLSIAPPPGPAAKAQPVRVLLALFAFYALVPAWLLAGFAALQLARTERAALISDAHDAARSLANLAGRELAGEKAGLLALGNSPAIASGNFETFADQAVALRQIGRFEVVLADSRRRIMIASGGPNREGAELPIPGADQRPLDPDRPELRLRAGLVTMVPDRQPRVAVELPVSGEGGGGPGAVIAFVTDPIALWSAAIEAEGLQQGWVGALADGRGAILARAPEASRFVGAPMHPRTLEPIQAAAGRPSGWIRAPAVEASGQPRDPETYYIAWHRVDGTDWVATIGVPVDQVEGTLSRALTPVLLGGVLMVPLTILLAWWGSRRVARPLAGLAEAAASIARGQTPLPVQSGVREIDALGLTLVHAAQERAAREGERMILAGRLETVLESTMDGVVMLDRAGRCSYVNHRAAEMLGPADTLLGRQAGEIFPADRENPLRAGLLAALQEGKARSATGYHAQRRLWLNADYYPSSDGVTAFFRDISAARSAENALRLGEARLKAVLDSIPVGVLLAEAPSGRIVLGNRRIEELFRHPVIFSPDIAHYGEWALVAPDGRPMTPQDNPLSRVLASGASAEAECLYRRGDGTMTWVRLLAGPIFDAEGRLSGAVLACTDIAEERRAAEALRASEQRFRTLAAAVPQIVWSTLPDGTVDYVNPRFTEFTGLEGADPTPGGVACHPEDAEPTREAWNRALRTGEAFAAEYRLRAADGGWRWFAARALPAHDEDDEGTITRWIGAATDVTELITARVALENQVLAEAAARQAAVAAAEALAASEERFRRFAEASPDLLWISDGAGTRMEYMSPAFERIFGEKRESLAGGGFWESRIHPEDREAAAKGWRADWPNRRLEAEYRVLRGDGSVRWIRVLGFPILDGGGRPVRRGGFARDITAEKAAEERQALLIGELNHRVKNTLATVHSLALQTARASGATPLPMDRFLADFQARLLALSRGHDLLTARTWHGATLEEVARAALAPWHPGEADAARLRLSGPAAWLVPKQALALSLALHELATNAAKHGAISRPEGQVALAWERGEDDMVTLTWVERGGPPASPPTRRGFGTRLLERGLPAELGPGAEVSLRYHHDGFQAVIRFRPIGRIVSGEDAAR